MEPRHGQPSSDHLNETTESILERGAVPSKLLYVSHVLSSWNTRAFEFGTILFLAKIYPGTLLPMSIYALIRAAAAIVLSYRVGRYIDTNSRLQVVRLSILGQRISVVLSCLGFLYLLLGKSHTASGWSELVFGVLTILACIEKLCSIMNTVAVERDWVIVIAGKDEGLLQELNSQMRRLDLFCKLMAPLAISLLDGLSTKVAVLSTLILNMCSMTVEYPFIAKVYQRTPALAQRESVFTPDPNPTDESEPLLQRTVSVTESLKESRGLLLATLRTYCSSAAFLPSLALSMLHLTVLSFSGQMTTFLLATSNVEMSSLTIGALKTVATAFELSATWIAPQLMATIGPVRAGIWCLSWQLLCLTSGVALLWSPEANETPKGIYLFIATVVLSRVGLWSFDLVAQLLIQNSIDASRRGAFSSAESSLQNFFSLCTFAMTIVFSDPSQFKFPALVSLVAIYCAAGTYAKYVRNRRGHLLHMPPCLKTPIGGQYEIADNVDDEE